MLLYRRSVNLKADVAIVCRISLFSELHEVEKALGVGSSFGEIAIFYLGHSWVTTNRNVSKFGRSQADSNGEKINENARVNTEAISRKELLQNLYSSVRFRSPPPNLFYN